MECAAKEILERHTRECEKTVKWWEWACSRQSDEDQQDMRLEIELTCEGKRIGLVHFRWDPDMQAARPCWGVE